jgi:P2 family phage contractile tail tube protein|nr:MAG TPA: major tail protein [Caudoviricetes sp.]
MFLNIKGAVLGCTVYRDGELVAKDCTVTLPGVTFLTAEHKAMGNVELPMLAQIEAMEAAITKKGYDVQLAKLARPEASNIEIRFVQDVIDADNVSKPEGCKVFMRLVPKTLPGSDLEVGAVGDTQVTGAVTRYQLFVGGDELCLVDQLKGIMRINGKDYAKNINSLL